MSVYDKLRRYPPVLCRLLARRRYGRPHTTREISEQSGIPAPLVAVLSEQLDWKGVEVWTAKAFHDACGVVMDDQPTMKRVEDYLRKGPTFRYLQRSPEWETLYLPLLLSWVRHCVDHPPVWPPLVRLAERLKPIAHATERKGNHRAAGR